MSASTFSVPENAAAGRAVGTFSASDPQGYPLSFTILSGNPNGAFAVNATTGAITVASGALNFLSVSSYALVVQATNAGAGSSLSSSATVTVNLVEVNKAPVFPTPTMALSVSENAAAGAAVGALFATDPNTHSAPTSRTDALTYSFAAGTAAPFFSLDASSGAITVAGGALLDYEAAPSYTFSVVVRDSGWDTANVVGVLSATGTVVISLVNRDDAPTAADQALAVNENSGASAVVGALAAADQDVASSSQTLSFALARPGSVCWSFTSLAGGLMTGASFVPLPLQPVAPAAGAVQTVYARVQSLAAGGTAFIVLSSAAAGVSPWAALAADSYVVALSSSGTSVSRCVSSLCGAPLAASATVFLAASSPSTASPFTNLRVDVAYSSASASSVTVYGFASGGAQSNTSAALVTLAAADTTPGARPVLQTLGVAASAAGARFSGLCFASASASPGALFAVAGAATATSATLTETASLNFEAQPAGFGLELQVTDVPRAG